ncbi:MAG: N-acetylmuramoyl-L-alanine amidase [Eubacterium sp.]
MSVLREMKPQEIELLMGICLILVVIATMINLNGTSDIQALSDNVGIGPGRETLETYGTVIIDAGHGGNDPGKIGVSGEVEKEINLQIAQKLKNVMEEKGFCVVMTRESDAGLYESTDSNKKRSDMAKRCEIINSQFESDDNTICISIHQNSYTSQSIHGAQVFYYSKSESGKLMAELIQQSLIENVDPTNTRIAKANSDYYILTHTDCPSVIVECGFLSNYTEAGKLSDEDYQQQLAEAILQGVIDFENSL